jgi:beta-galactosidase
MAGPAVWRGGYNSGKEGSTNLTHLDLEAGINRIALRATREAGRIILKASSQGLAGAELVLEAKPAVGENGVIPLPPPSAVPEWLRGPGKFLDTPPGPKLAPPGKGGNEIDRVLIDGKGNDHGMA